MGTGKVVLPGVLRAAIGEVREVAVSGGSVQAALEDLCEQLPTLRSRLLDEQGRLRRHVLCVVDREVVDPAAGHPFPDGTEILIMPAVSGG